jgi:oligo-1,6-glucosidase
MTDWWKEETAYQIYPRSFQDTNGDGIGDLTGIRNRLPLLKDLGIGILWLSPVYASPNDDNGYDISDYRSIHPDFGTMEDMLGLIADAKSLGIRIVMDLVINHTSDEHPWFQASRDPSSPYRDYYIWRPGKNGGPPNNWTGFFAGSCWDLDDKSGEYYMHLFSKKQPDLNYQNPDVIREIEDIMRFWLDLGVSGFRCDVINVIWKTSLEDGKKKLILTGSERYLSQDGAHKILKHLRKNVLSKYDCFTVGETVFVTPEMGHELCDREREELDMIFSFEHMETDQYIVKWFRRKFHPARFAKKLAVWQNELEWNANYFENHDQPRSVSRFANDTVFHRASAKMLGLLLLSLRGTPFIYQGQEIGMTNFDYKGMSQIRDIESLHVYDFLRSKHLPKWLCWRMVQKSGRDNARTPMQWSKETNAGFTNGTPWIDVNQNYTRINYADQLEDPNSILHFYRKMIAFRKENEALRTGEFQLIKATRRLFVFMRVCPSEALTVLINFSPKPMRYMKTGKVVMSTTGRSDYDGYMSGHEALILRDEVPND